MTGRAVHRLVACAAILWAGLHAATVIAQRRELHPFTGLGWTREHLLGAALVGGLGILAVATRPRTIVAAVLAIVPFAIALRWLSVWLGALAAAALIDGALLAERWWAKAGWGALALAGALFAAGLRTPAGVPHGPHPSVAGGSCDDARRLVGDALEAEMKALDPTLQPLFCRNVVERMAAIDATGLRLSLLDIKSRLLGFERFRLETALSSGVAPKRYFGFLDEAGDTAAYEKTLRETVIAAVALANADAERRGVPTRLSEKEVAVTFFAEGGALVLGDRTEDLEDIHPVTGIGLDDFRTGFARHAELVRALDQRLGTALSSLTLGGMLRRTMTFKEAIAGTTIMYVVEKELTASKLLTAGGASTRLETLPLDRQFVFTSLVYNSGILFSDERVDQILAFATGEYLAGVNEANQGKRPTLALSTVGNPLPTQRTSWSAVYHVLQRYGAWVALGRFTDLFDDDGRFRARS